MTRRRESAPRLFERNEMSFERTGLARLRGAVRAIRNPTLRELEADEDERTIKRLRAMADDLIPCFRLKRPRIEAERDGVVEHYGVCYEDGEIRIRLRHARTGRLLKESSLVDTLCHELAHLRHMDHSERFKRLYLRILGKARDLGYYRPGPVATAPQQRRLFDQDGCESGVRCRTGSNARGA